MGQEYAQTEGGKGGFGVGIKIAWDIEDWGL